MRIKFHALICICTLAPKYFDHYPTVAGNKESCKIVGHWDLDVNSLARADVRVASTVVELSFHER
jgi:hypothetical protein